MALQSPEALGWVQPTPSSLVFTPHCTHRCQKILKNGSGLLFYLRPEAGDLHPKAEGGLNIEESLIWVN